MKPDPANGSRQRPLVVAVTLVTVVALMELVWWITARHWQGWNNAGTALVDWVHPSIREAPERVLIAANYSHALWLLLAWLVAYGLLRLVAASLRGGLRVPSPWVAALPVAVVATAAVVTVLVSRLNRPEFTPEQLAQRAENEQAMGTGAASYDRVLDLLSRCHQALRRRLSSKADVIIDAGVAPPLAYIYTYEKLGLRFVSVAPRTNDISSANVGAPVRELMPPIEGGYIVQGIVTYPGDVPAVSSRDYRLYNCSILVTEGHYKLVDLAIKPIR
jgi:hypothetical protein